MFLHLLNDSQQKSFLVLAKQFIEVDRKLSDDEQNMLELMYAEMGLPFDAELPEGDLDALLPAFDSRQARASVLLELMSVGHADREFAPEESALLKRIADGFGVSAQDLEAMDDWVRRQLALAEDVQKFWMG